ncbi:MAG: glycosyltransferase family 2 protein [Aliidongia sp.]
MTGLLPRVSIVIPAFNEAALLPAALDSVRQQSLEEFECIVVDDGSTDPTPAILADYARRDRRFRIVTRTNGGISRALNAGLAVAQAPWIARLDADDIMLPSRLHSQLAFAEANPDLAACGCCYDIIDMAGRRRGTRRPLPRDRDELNRFLTAREPLSFTHPTMLYRRDLALRLGGYRPECEPCEDVDLFARMLATGAAILIQPEVLMQYRIRPGSLSGRKSRLQFQMTRCIYHNFHAAQAGQPVLTLAEFELFERRRPLHARLRTCLLAWSDQLYRRYSAALTADRPMQAACYLAVAALLRPTKAIRRACRGVWPYLVGAFGGRACG